MTTPLSKYLKKVIPPAFIACIIIAIVFALLARPGYEHFIIDCAWQLNSRRGEMPEDALERDIETLENRLAALENRLRISRSSVKADDKDNMLTISFRAEPESLEEILFWLTLDSKVNFSLLHPDPNAADIYGKEHLPDGYQLSRYRHHFYNLSRPGELKVQNNEYVISKKPVLSLHEFDSVKFDTRGLHQTTVLIFEFKSEHEEKFKEVTALNIGREMAMLIDGHIFFPPREIQRPIEEGIVEIHGYFYNPPLRKLVDMLDAGSLFGSLKITSTSTEND